MSVTPEWIIAIIAFLTLGSAIIGALWRFSKSVDKQTFVVNQILDNMKIQWKRIDEHGDSIDEHEGRIMKLETWKEFHERISDKKLQ
jgi:hypothetical protein